MFSTAVVLFLIVGLVAYLNLPVVMVRASFGSVVLFLAGASLACFAMSLLACIIGQSVFFEYIGRNSILFLFAHFYMIDVTHFAFNTFFGRGFTYSFPYYWIHFILAIVGCTGFSWLVNGYLPFLKKLPTSNHAH